MEEIKLRRKPSANVVRGAILEVLSDGSELTIGQITKLLNGNRPRLYFLIMGLANEGLLEKRLENGRYYVRLPDV